jgi:penicillin amidase
MMRIVKGLIKLILICDSLVGDGNLAAGMLWVSRSQAPSDGAMRIAGLGGEVTITRDVNGVPHIKAATRGDVAAGLGFRACTGPSLADGSQPHGRAGAPVGDVW